MQTLGLILAGIAFLIVAGGVIGVFALLGAVKQLDDAD